MFNFLSSIIILVTVQVRAQNLPIEILPTFTNPQCQAYEAKPLHAYCTRADLPNAQKKENGPFKKIIELIGNRNNKEIIMGTMTFSNKEVAAALCKALKNRVKVSLLVDSAIELVTAESVEKCGAELIKIGVAEVEGEKRGDLHHNKFLLVNAGEKSTLVFSSANFSNPGLTINHETWTFVNAESNSYLIEQHNCLVKALKEYKDNLAQFKSDLNRCRAEVRARPESKIESLFIPADSSKLIKLIDENIKKSKRVLMTSNRYSYDKITNAIANSQSRDNRVVFDDDLYWGGLQPTPDYVNEALDAKKVQQLERANVKVKFMQTSFKAAQKMHSKFIVFDNLVIVGAGNFTYAGMTSNFENFYVIRDPITIEKFKSQFEYLWSLATYRNQMPKEYIDF